MKTLIEPILIVAFAIGVIVALANIMPTNPTPCFGKTKDGGLRWHAVSECAHSHQ